jgi:hypothetical protein
MAAKKAGATANNWSPNPKKKRPGIHAKSKRSVSKRGKHYVKAYRGQGR